MKSKERMRSREWRKMGRREGEAENKKNTLSIEELSGLRRWEGMERPRAWRACQESEQNLLNTHVEMPL